MREAEYLQSLHFNSLRTNDGTIVNMSLPIVLAIDDEAKERIGSSTNVGLVGPSGDLIAILRRSVSVNDDFLWVWVFFFFFNYFLYWY